MVYYGVTTTELRYVMVEYEIPEGDALGLIDAASQVMSGKIKPTKVTDLPADNRDNPDRSVVSLEIAEMSRS